MTNSQTIILTTCVLLFMFMSFLFCCAVSHKFGKHALVGSSLFAGAMILSWAIYFGVSLTERGLFQHEKKRTIRAYELKTADMVVPNFFPPSELDIAQQMAAERKVELTPLYAKDDK